MESSAEALAPPPGNRARRRFRSDAERLAARRRAARAILIAGAAAAAFGLALGYIAGPFFIILYCQLAFLALSVFIVVKIRGSTVVLPVFIAFLLAFAFDKLVLAAVLCALFLVLLAGRSVLGSRMNRIAFTVIAFTLAAFGLLGFFFWSRISVRDPGATDRSADVDALESLPYQASVEDEQHDSQNGVVSYDKRAAVKGLNLYNSYYQAGAELLDMDGRRLHAWLPPALNPQWHCVAVCDNGDLLVCIEDTMLARLDWDSRIVWTRPLRVHHEVAQADNGDIYTLASEGEKVILGGVPVPIIDDTIVVLSGDGTVKKRISVFGLLKDKLSALTIGRIYGEILDPPSFLWKTLKRRGAGRPSMDRLTPFDVFHDNTISLAVRDIPGVAAKGDVLISAAALNLIGVVDMARETMRWTWGPGQIEGQHQPTFLENGNVLVFDNGTRREYSRLLELDPRTGKIVWEYHALHPTPFYTSWGGGAQRFANGNTLVTESDDGRVFEITRDGQIVWEFYNPSRAQDGKRATIYRMTRIINPGLQDLLRRNIKTES